MKVLVVGKGGREHAIITALHESPTETEIYSFPGSDAIFELAKPVQADGVASLVSYMKENGIDLCVAGEESYLVKDEGLANACAAAGIPCWGPPKEAAQLEAGSLCRRISRGGSGTTKIRRGSAARGRVS